ncbi:hypothetical protein [Brevibacterium otitidis]|uniref:Uncharacterized protein n=1 Tax=Brevibacterium otitidis TaxID=53364 RepID=A0ABV5WZV1_9MICO|nr:hypothetical protein GCM10023233_26400 [Brevibacterium otitidis]
MKKKHRDKLGVLVVLVAAVALFAVIFFLIGYALPWFSETAREIPWISSLVILVGFLIAVLWRARPGWTMRGIIVLFFTVLAGAILDIAGNPILYAPYEQLFLEPGQKLRGAGLVETIGGETHMTGRTVVVNADAEEVRTVSFWFIGTYRLVCYAMFYSILLTVLGAFANRRAKAAA